MRVVLIFCAAILLVGLTACGGGDKPAATKEVEKTGDPLPPGLFVDKAPAGELPLAEAKKSAKAGETIVLRGLVRGVTTAFIPNRAIVQLADEAVPKCPMNPDRPWDLHCETPESMAKNTATVQIVGADGKPLKRGLQGVNGLEHMAPVVVKGTVVSADEKGNLLITATEIFVEKKKG
jgi:hypothetical protein